MKIDNSVGPVGGLPGGDGKSRSSRSSSSSTSGQSTSEVELSSVASKLQEVQSALGNVPVADASRVAEIKQAITQGHFKVDAGKVADGLIESARQMINSQARRA